jgi:RecA-family ATPase
MRVGGTVSYPAKHKAERGYTKELTTIRTTYEDARPPVSLDQMRRAFGSYGPAKSGPSFEIDTGDQPRLDRERATIQAMQGVEWHNAVIRLVGSYVAKGLSDGEIHALTAPLTLAGYTADQTAREVQVAIDGARRKGWTPEAAPVKEMTEEERNAIPAALFRPWVAKDLAAIPYPQFVYSDFYARGYTSVTLAAPKVGKSMLALAEALDMSTGRGFLTGHERQPLRVVYYNAEDDQDVIDGRVAALMKHYGIDQSEIVGRFFPTSGVELDDFFMVAGQDAVINEALFVSIERFCEENAADVLIFDPLQDLSRSPETNEVFRALGGRLRRMANKTKVALGLIHHTRKVAPGMTPSIDDMRGGSALRGTARFNRILVSMTEDEAAKGGLPNHRHFFRIGDMESNLAPPSADVNRWYQKVSVPTPNGQFVGAVEAWEWPDAFNGVTPEDARKVQVAVSHMEDDPPRLSIQSKNWVGYVVARMMSLDAEEKADKARIASMVNAWIKSGVLIVEEVRDTRNGRDAKVILAGPNNPLTGVTA